MIQSNTQKDSLLFQIYTGSGKLYSVNIYLIPVLKLSSPKKILDYVVENILTLFDSGIIMDSTISYKIGNFKLKSKLAKKLTQMY